MLPLGHAALAYLLYVGYAFVRSHRLPANWALLPLAVGSQLPDLIDKSLAYIGLLQSGRSLAHSVFTFVLVTGFMWWGAKRLRSDWPETAWQSRLRAVLPTAFAVGYLGHLLGDLSVPLLAGDYYDARFLLYPIYTLVRNPVVETAPWIRLARTYRNMGTHPQIELILLATIVFVGLRVRARLIDVD